MDHITRGSLACRLAIMTETVPEAEPDQAEVVDGLLRAEHRTRRQTGKHPSCGPPSFWAEEGQA